VLLQKPGDTVESSQSYTTVHWRVYRDRKGVKRWPWPYLYCGERHRNGGSVRFSRLRFPHGAANGKAGKPARLYRFALAGRGAHA
jgi:hypothetical protein